MIASAISGTYTPILLTVVGGWIGWTVFILYGKHSLWGILYKSIAVKVNQKLSLIVYLVMGWVGIILLPIIYLAHHGYSYYSINFLGGVSYTIGAWFYAQKNRPYFHMIWHIFIVIASLLHLIAILYFM